MPSDSQTIFPTVSLSSPTVIDDIKRACTTIGGFVLIDHGIPTTFLGQVLATGHAFFALSDEKKDKYNLHKYGAKWRGYMPLGGERSEDGTLVDIKDGLYMGDEHSAENELAKANMPTFGSNVFPDAEIPEMRALLTQYHKRMKHLGDNMMDLLSQSLGLDATFLQTHVTKHNPVILPRMFRYPPQQNTGGEDKGGEPHFGIGGHSDYGLWTMLLTDQPGLEFQHEASKQWIPVPFVNHGIIMNVGDVLDRLTSGRFISPFHRTRNLSSQTHRLSLPFFYGPAWDARLHTLPITKGDGVIPTTNPPPERWAYAKIQYEFDGSVEYSQFLAKEVAKVFPDLVPEEYWKSLMSTSSPSTRHALVVEVPDVVITDRVKQHVQHFYEEHTEIKVSHGMKHVMAVYAHACHAVNDHQPPLTTRQAMEVLVATLLHDVDDHKYFPLHKDYNNARALMAKANVPSASVETIVFMISVVSCSQNGNSLPRRVEDSEEYHLLIPRWSDRLEAVGKRGVVRCYQYNQESGMPLSSASSPRPSSEEELWQCATPERFEAYQRTGTSADMISHYYDKLLHVACPPRKLVRNSYLERMALQSSEALVTVCLRFGKTGTVDEEYIESLAKELQ